MKVLHVISSLDKKYGGPSKALVEMVLAQKRAGICPEIAATRFPGENPEVPERVKTRFFERCLGEYKYSPGMRKWLEEHIKKYDIVHIHSVFVYSTMLAARLAEKEKIPYIVRTIGQLYEWSLRNKSYLLKKIYLELIEKRTLEKAAMLHFTTEDERDNLIVKLKRKQGYVLPLGVRIGGVMARREAYARFPGFEDKKILLFISRIHPKKGLETVIPVINGIFRKYPDWILVIAGEGRESYVNELKEKIDSLHTGKHVHFTGYVFGKEKEALLSLADIYILPSYTENFGVAVAEALAYGKPVCISKNVGIASDIKKYNAGKVFELREDSISESLGELMCSERKRTKMGANALRLAGEKYDWDTITQKQIKIYEKIIKGEIHG
ncbi:MAG: glycosyltransferase [Candidatus Omnitrophica bacterium]|nr:glycosyltransferase [Candidatus Omnitrophota bacterium]